MASLYEFVYRKLVDANIQREIAPIDDALKILHHQRETWMMVIEKVRKNAARPNPPRRRPLGPRWRAPARTPPRREDAFAESTLCVEG